MKNIEKEKKYLIFKFKFNLLILLIFCLYVQLFKIYFIIKYFFEVI